MYDGNLLVLRGNDAQILLDGREREIMRTVRAAYIAHALGESSLPHSTFLNFPNEGRNRIIALPAYLGNEFGVAGVKWISSFPNNLSRGMDRASAVVILNSLETGRPEAILEGSVISAKRTAASAALAAAVLADGEKLEGVTMVGCGLINFEIARFLKAACPTLKKLYLFDLSSERAAKFKENCEATFEGVTADVVADLSDALGREPVISLATTAIKPHISSLSACAPGSVVLHISLRDLTPEVVLDCDNIVDDIEHVCRAQTSLHLAEQLTGGRGFIRCALADILTGVAPARENKKSIAVFSPFGLGVLDMAVAKLVRDLGVTQERGAIIKSFLPKPWDSK
jgi:N-[(2S)-2-amino-2-carboxyethyl]-L-glutamate dehydrogenase